jgi:patatin-like phospholipase/acyl hydrolase
MAFRILSIDAGGTRGAYPVYLLQKIQQEWNVDLTQFFDLIIGTSSGSILGTAVALEYPLEKVLDFFVNASEKVLLPQRFSLHGFLKSKYQKEFLEKAVYSAIGDTTFAAVKKPLIIPATDIEQGEPYVFKSGYTAESKTHDAVRLVDAIVSSCSAPLYFDPHRTEGRLLSDGGLWAKNPALVAVVETLGVFKRIPEEIRVLSLGTGIEKVTYTAEEGKSKNWGLMQEWRSTQLASAFFHFQTRATEHMVTSLIPSNNYLRLDFEHSGLLRIDDFAIIRELERLAEETIERYREALVDFFGKK